MLITIDPIGFERLPPAPSRDHSVLGGQQSWCSTIMEARQQERIAQIQANLPSKPNLKQLSQPLTKAEPVLADNVLTA
jgi:hypothetical protein